MFGTFLRFVKDQTEKSLVFDPFLWCGYHKDERGGEMHMWLHVKTMFPAMSDSIFWGVYMHWHAYDYYCACLHTLMHPYRHKCACLYTAAHSSQWFSWGPAHMQCRLCSACWMYWKKYGGLKMPTRLGKPKLVRLSDCLGDVAVSLVSLCCYAACILS